MTRSDTLTERVHRITIGDGRSTEALVEAGHYGYAHSAVVFLHEPWLGNFGRRDVLLLWDNAGRRELGLEGFDNPLSRDYRFAFVRPFV